MISTDSFICLKCVPFQTYISPCFYMYFAKQKSYYLHLLFDSAIHCKHLFVSMSKYLLVLFLNFAYNFMMWYIKIYSTIPPYLNFYALNFRRITDDSTLSLHPYTHFSSCTKISKECIPRNSITDRNFVYMYLSFDIY